MGRQHSDEHGGAFPSLLSPAEGPVIDVRVQRPRLGPRRPQRPPELPLRPPAQRGRRGGALHQGVVHRAVRQAAEVSGVVVVVVAVVSVVSAWMGGALLVETNTLTGKIGQIEN